MNLVGALRSSLFHVVAACALAAIGTRMSPVTPFISASLSHHGLLYVAVHAIAIRVLRMLGALGR